MQAWCAEPQKKKNCRVCCESVYKTMAWLLVIEIGNRKAKYDMRGWN